VAMRRCSAPTTPICATSLGVRSSDPRKPHPSPGSRSTAPRMACRVAVITDPPCRD
jgi:hypothetical protein